MKNLKGTPKNMTDIPETLLGLVNAYSPSGQEKPAVDFLVKHMQALHFTQSFVDAAGNAVGVMGKGPRQIVLLGHIDTVPGEIPVHAEIAESDKGFPSLYGRGSVDAKGPLAAFVDAVAAMGPLEGWQYVVIGAVGEEKDSDGARYIAPLYYPDFAVIGEPSHWERVTLGYKGSAWVRLIIRRSLAHTAGQGESACEAAVKAWEAIIRLASDFSVNRSRSFDQVLPTLRGMDSGSNGFEEWASLQIGTRLPLDLTPQQWYSTLENLPTLKSTLGISFEKIGFPIPAFQGEKNNPLVRAFLKAIRSAGGQPGFVLKTGTADLNIIAPYWGCPALAYGPGDSTLDHTPDEHLSIEEYRQAVEVLRSVLEQLSSR
jgi:LysW-gamma-L-lysine carboxypeptidase